MVCRDTRGVSDAMAAALASDLPAHSSPSSASVRSVASGATGEANGAHASWHPRGILIAHLAEHRSMIASLVHDHSHFVIFPELCYF